MTPSCTDWFALDDAKIMAITAEVSDFVMKWAFLRANAVVQQFLPALAHIYEIIPFWTRYLLVSRKPILDFESCDQLSYTQRIESVSTTIQESCKATLIVFSFRLSKPMSEQDLSSAWRRRGFLPPMSKID